MLEVTAIFSSTYTLFRHSVRRWPCNNQVVSSNLTGVLFLFFFTGFFKNSEKNCRQYLKNMQLIISFPFSNLHRKRLLSVPVQKLVAHNSNFLCHSKKIQAEEASFFHSLCPKRAQVIF